MTKVDGHKFGDKDVELHQAIQTDSLLLFRLQHLDGKAIDLSNNKQVDSLNEYKKTLKPELISVIVVESQKVGRLRVVREEDKIYIGGFQILPDYRNRGIGSIIIRRLIKESEQTKQVIRLEVFNNNPKAKALYVRHGFEVDSIQDTVTQMIFIPK